MSIQSHAENLQHLEQLYSQLTQTSGGQAYTDALQAIRQEFFSLPSLATFSQEEIFKLKFFEGVVAEVIRRTEGNAPAKRFVQDIDVLFKQKILASSQTQVLTGPPAAAALITSRVQETSHTLSELDDRIAIIQYLKARRLVTDPHDFENTLITTKKALLHTLSEQDEASYQTTRQKAERLCGINLSHITGIHLPSIDTMIRAILFEATRANLPSGEIAVAKAILHHYGCTEAHKVDEILAELKNTILGNNIKSPLFRCAAEWGFR